MIRTVAVVSLLVAALWSLAPGCSKDKPDRAAAPEGLPPLSVDDMPTAMPGSVQGGNPHAGVGAADPHAGLAMGGDPHAGLAMGGDPHGGMAAVNPHGEPQAVDPSKYVRGAISVAGEAAGAVKAGDIIFISVKPVDPATGAILGGTIAVDRVDVTQLPVAFELTGANVMTQGAVFEGDVVVTARVDRDGEARTREAGDVEGSTTVAIPADGVSLVLDTIVN
jgi:hypothetical protein